MGTLAPSTADPRAPARRALAILAAHGAPLVAGAGLALTLRVAPSLRPEYTPGPTTTWVADRDANAVVGLDDGLFEARRFEIESPVELETTIDGGLWVVSARDSHPLGPHDLVLYDPRGGRVAAAVFGPVLDLDRLGDDALIVERAVGGAGAHGRVVRVDARGETSTLLELAGARCAAGSGHRVAVGTEDGAVWLLDATDGPARMLAKHDLGGSVSDVRAGPAPGTWWALACGAATKLALLGPTLTPRWTAAIGLHALHLAPQRGQERVWIADTTAPLARRYGAGGALELEVADLPLAGLDRAVALGDGGALFAAPGAVLRVDGRGALAPGQGGFDFLVDIDR